MAASLADSLKLPCGADAKRQMALLPAFLKFQAGEAKTAKALEGRP